MVRAVLLLHVCCVHLLDSSAVVDMPRALLLLLTWALRTTLPFAETSGIHIYEAVGCRPGSKGRICVQGFSTDGKDEHSKALTTPGAHLDKSSALAAGEFQV